MKRLLLATILAGSMACAAAPPPAPKPFDPVGTYSFSTAFQGQPISGVIIVEARETGFGGMVTPDAGPPPVPITAVTVSARAVTIHADAGGDLLIIVMEVAEDGSYTGSWSLGADAGTLAGVKRPQ